MKRFAALLLFAASVLAPAPAAPLLQNGGFETGDLSNWTYTGEFEVTPGGGDYWALFASSGVATLQQAVAVVPTGVYELSFNVANFGGGENSLAVSFGGRTLDSIADTDGFDFTTVRIANLTVDQPAATLGFALSGSGWALDNVKLTRTDQLIQNGSFETGDYSGWQRWSNNATAPYTNHVAEGAYAARLGSKDGNTGWRGGLAQTVETEAGREYEVSFWLKSPGYGFKEFTASFGADTVFDYARSGEPAAYARHSGVVQVTGSSAELRFTENNQGFWYLDAVTVSLLAQPDIRLAEAIAGAPKLSVPGQSADLTDAPEPKSFGLLAAGLGLLLAARSRRLRWNN